jgi:5'-nucleotidase
LALNQILAPDIRPDICASGINHGANLGDDASYSGTVAGALEATILGVPGLAFSLVASHTYDFSESGRIAREVTEKALRDGIPDGTLLNVNIPVGPAMGMKVTTQGFKSARPVISEHIDPRGKLYYWIGEERDGFRAEGGTDFEAIDEGYVSITPMRSDMTNHLVLEQIKDWETGPQ